MEPLSHSKFIENTSHCIMDAFRYFGVSANQVLLYDDLFPYLEHHDPKFRDTMREAENYLSRQSVAVPDAVGLRLTEMGFQQLRQRW